MDFNEEKSTQVLTFRIERDYFSIPIVKIQEIIKIQHSTHVPLTPNYISGLINLRGQIVTAISLRNLLGYQPSVKTGIENEEEIEKRRNIIISQNDNLYSLIADEIYDVIEVSGNAFQETPKTLEKAIRPYINGVYKLDDMLLINLEIDHILKADL